MGDSVSAHFARINAENARENRTRQKYPNRLRLEHIQIGNFIWFEGNYKGIPRNCPALIYMLSSYISGPSFHLIFLDTMEMERTESHLTQPLDYRSYNDADIGQTTSYERSCMRACPREDAVKYVKRQYSDLMADNPSIGYPYMQEAQSFGLM